MKETSMSGLFIDILENILLFYVLEEWSEEWQQLWTSTQVNSKWISDLFLNKIVFYVFYVIYLQPKVTLQLLATNSSALNVFYLRNLCSKGLLSNAHIFPSLLLFFVARIWQAFISYQYTF